MLWYKSWLETRWRFLIGFALLMCSAGTTVLTWPQVVKLMPAAAMLNLKGTIGRQVQEALEVQRTYRGYIWAQWFGQNLPQMWTLFAVLLGAGSLLSGGSGATLFTLSLPLSRRRLMGIRTATGFAELFVLAFVPSLLVAALSPAVGESYGLGDVLIHSACLFIAGAVFFSLTILLSTIFNDLWRPLLIALSIAIVLAVASEIFRDVSRYSIFGAMSAQVWFREGSIPWLGLLASAIASGAMLYFAAMNLDRRDF